MDEPQKSKPEDIIEVIKATLSGVSDMAASIATLIEDYVPASRMSAIQRTFENFGNCLKVLETRIDPAIIHKDEFIELFDLSLPVIIRTTQAKKLNLVSALLANIFLKEADPQKLPYPEIDHMLRCVDNLSTAAIEVLEVAYDIAGARLGVEPKNLYEHRFDFKHLSTRIPEYEPSFLMGLVGQLHSTNLLHIPARPSVRLPDYANYLIELTPLGIRFVERLLRL